MIINLEKIMEIFISLLGILLDNIKHIYPKNRDMTIFNEIIIPLHKEFEKVSKRYWKLFYLDLENLFKEDQRYFTLNEDGRYELANHTDSLTETLKKIEDRRSKYLQGRLKITAIMEAISKKTDNKEILEYCETVNDFFFLDRNLLQDDQVQRRIFFNKKRLEKNIRKHFPISEEEKVNSKESSYSLARPSCGGAIIELLRDHLNRLDKIDEKFKDAEIREKYILSYIESIIDNMETTWGKALKIYTNLSVSKLCL